MKLSNLHQVSKGKANKIPCMSGAANVAESLNACEKHVTDKPLQHIINCTQSSVDLLLHGLVIIFFSLQSFFIKRSPKHRTTLQNWGKEPKTKKPQILFGATVATQHKWERNIKLPDTPKPTGHTMQDIAKNWRNGACYSVLLGSMGKMRK